MNPDLYGIQFQGIDGPLGSYGEPGPVGVGYDGSGVLTGPGDIYGA